MTTELQSLIVKRNEIGFNHDTKEFIVAFSYHCPTCGREMHFRGLSKRTVYRHLKQCRRKNEP